jgi:hypothetical protein
MVARWGSERSSKSERQNRVMDMGSPLVRTQPPQLPSGVAFARGRLEYVKLAWQNVLFADLRRTVTSYTISIILRNVWMPSEKYLLSVLASPWFPFCGCSGYNGF